TKDLQIIKGQDHVTLVTCTPYGINTHRLLVRGTRVPYDSTINVTRQTVQPVRLVSPTAMALIIAGGIMLLFFIILLLLKLKEKRRENS
ncbi:MAG: sortase, partial [Clostridia bacterium]|nr:sortase [Clostridia bacterium]